MLAVVVLLPVGRASEAPIAIGALAALVLLARGRIDWRDEAIRLAAVLFACYWMPALLSAIAPVAPARTWSTVGSTLRFLPFAVFVVWALRDARRWSAATSAIAAVVALWIIDAFVQMTTGYSLGGAGRGRAPVRASSAPGNLKLGPVLAVLSPFVLIAARDAFGWRGLAVAFVLLAVPILLAGSRAAWIMYALVCLAIAWRETPSKRAFALVLGVSALIVAAVARVALRDSQGFGARIERSLLVLRGTESAVDTASAGRAQHLAHGESRCGARIR